MQIRYEICYDGDPWWERVQTPFNPEGLANLLGGKIRSDDVGPSWGERDFSIGLPGGDRLVFLAWTGDPRLIYVRAGKKK